MLRDETLEIGKMLERTMMKAYGPADLKKHYMVLDTICDATQVCRTKLAADHQHLCALLCWWTPWCDGISSCGRLLTAYCLACEQLVGRYATLCQAGLMCGAHSRWRCKR